MTVFLVRFVEILTTVLTYAIFFRAILSWFPIAADNPIVQLVHQMTEPVLAPLRRIVPRIGMIDITPLVALVLLQLVGEMIIRVF